MWHENPLTKFDDNTNYFVCFFVFSNVCSLNLWFASVIDKFDLGYIKKLISDNFNGSDNMNEKFCLKSF